MPVWEYISHKLDKKEKIHMTLLDSAAAVAKAGADIIVTGTIVEKTENIQPALKELITAVKKRS